MLADKFKKIDYKEAIEDVIPFIKDAESLKLWDSKFFISITEKLS